MAPDLGRDYSGRLGAPSGSLRREIADE